MPQDGWKSSVYRSFFSCDDPKGVAQYKTIRKSKTESHKSEDQKQQKSQDMSFSCNPPQNEKFPHLLTDKLDDPSSIKLGEITKGAQKLNQVIDTCSNKTNFDRQSKDIAKDLLKGALDLQESLEMLGKLQEASNYMSKWKRKQKEKSVGGKLDVIERASSDHFRTRTALQSPRISVDGSSKDCYEELREAIREGLAKQNLLPKSSSEVSKAYIDRNKSFGEEKPYFDRVEVPNREKDYIEMSKSFSETNSYFGRRKLELSPDFPSTSSSQTSRCHSHEFDSTDTSFSRSFEENSQVPNVVAKLMGLEENIPKSPQPNVRQLRKEKGLNYARPIFDMDFPMARSSHFSSVQKVESRQRTFEELVQTVQYKGPVSGKSFGISGTPKQLPMVYDKERRLAEDGPPIAIIKPYRFHGYDPKEIIRKLKMKEMVFRRTSNVDKSALNISDMQRSLQAEISPQRLSHDKGDARCGEAYARTNDAGTKGQEELQSNRTKAFVSGKPKLQKKEVIRKKVDKVHRSAPNTRTEKEVDTFKLRDVPRTRTTDQTTSTSSRKPHRVSDSSKDQIAQQKAASCKLSEASTLESLHSSAKRKKKPENAVTTPPSTCLVKTELEDDDIQINQNSEAEHDLSVIKLVISENLACTKEKDFDPSLDAFNVNGSHVSGYTTQFIEQNSDTKSCDTSTCCTTNNPNAKRSCNEEATKVTRNLLLNSALFLDKLEDMFHISVNQPVVSHTNSLPDNKMSDPKDLLDTAKELLEYKDLQSTQEVQPCSYILTKTSRTFIDRLVGEICEGIEDLRSYHNFTSEQASGDSLDKVLDKDLWCKGIVSGGWDFGWKSGFTRDEVEQIVINIEQDVLRLITEETLEHMLS